MKIGFLNNQIDNRGTGNALFDYAHYNEEILGNKSVIITLDKSPRNPIMEKRLIDRFGAIETTWVDIDALYHIKYGNIDYPTSRWWPYLVHAVFDASQPHGDRYAAISEWLGKRNFVPWVPHIVRLPNGNDSLRHDIGIPNNHTVFGRHGGSDTFDIPFVWDAINKALGRRKDIWFLFMNTNKPDIEFTDPKRVVFVDEAETEYHKRVFINTCDAMLHARARGETFGIAVGEFDICGKPIITYGASPEQAHIDQARLAYVYYNERDIVNALLDIDWKKLQGSTLREGYARFTPESVMKQFGEVFLK